MKANQRALIQLQSGFAHILIIAIVIVISVVGFAGYLVTKNSLKSQNDQEDSITANTSDPEQQQEATSDPGAIPVQNNNTDHQGDSVQTTTNTNQPQEEYVPPSTSTGGSSSGGSSGGGSGSGGTQQPSTRTFNIDSFSFGYSLSSISVKAGDTVTINLTNSGGSHDWVVDELNVATKIISKGKTDSITFTVPASSAGQTYQFYCSVGSHRQQGMVGSFIVN